MVCEPLVIIHCILVNAYLQKIDRISEGAQCSAHGPKAVQLPLLLAGCAQVESPSLGCSKCASPSWGANAPHTMEKVTLTLGSLSLSMGCTAPAQSPTTVMAWPIQWYRPPLAAVRKTSANASLSASKVWMNFSSGITILVWSGPFMLPSRSPHKGNEITPHSYGL